MREPDKKCTFTTNPSRWPIPEVGMYMVNIGVKGILSVWLIAKVVPIKHKVASVEQGYKVDAYDCPDLKELVVSETYPSGYVEVWVRGEKAIPAWRIPWKKKKKP